MIDDRTSHDLPGFFDKQREVDPAERFLVLPTRGVKWVLQWSAALAVLLLAASVLAEFAYILTAEHALARAARAAAVEATLPRATRRSIVEAAQHQLAGYPGITRRVQHSINRNDVAIGGIFRPQPGDRVGITLSAPAETALPRWLNAMRFWHGPQHLVGQATRVVPGPLMAPPRLGALDGRGI